MHRYLGCYIKGMPPLVIEFRDSLTQDHKLSAAAYLTHDCDGRPMFQPLVWTSAACGGYPSRHMTAELGWAWSAHTATCGSHGRGLAPADV